MQRNLKEDTPMKSGTNEMVEEVEENSGVECPGN
jgi:hypothetical protein